MNDEKIIKLQHFFSSDFKMKKEMLDVAPMNIGQYYDDDSLIKYVNKLADSLIYMFSELKCIASDIFGCKSNVFNRINYIEQVTKSNFFNCGLDIEKLKRFYQKFISNMELSFINSVKEECVGYTISGTQSIECAVSINELLHFIHSYIINNDNILKSIPVIDEKYNKYNYPISLRGVEVPIFKQLFTMFPTNMDCGWTDMVVINEKKLIMMVRDRGHALSIEISLNNNIARIEYFIPKLCNIEMINKLPGVNKVNQNNVGATGVIEVTINDLPSILFDFISKVPMDSDIVFESGKSI